MLAAFRAIANTWLARLFFFALAFSFVVWGVADVVNHISGPAGDTVASIGASRVGSTEFQFAYDRAIKEEASHLTDPTQIPPALRRQVGQQVLQRLLLQRAFADQARALGLATPDAALRDIVAQQREFQDNTGKFNRTLMLQFLANAQLSEGRYLEMLREDQTRLQLADTLATAAYPPKVLTNLVFDFLAEGRSADMIVLPLARFPLPPAPADNVLHRYWANNQQHYSAPEYRHVKLVVLSAQTVGKSLTVSDADIDQAYAANRLDYESPEKRSLQVITTADEASARALLAAWRHGADWQAIQAQAAKLGASAIELTDTTRTAIPSPELAAASFAAHAGDFIGPLKQPLGVQIARLLSIMPAKATPRDEARARLRDQLATARAQDMVDERAQKLQDLFAGGATIDEVPADIGAAAAAGTLDRLGRTPDGTPAPLPGSDAFRRDVLGAIFTAKQGEAPQLNDGADRHYYAMVVDKITPAAVRPFEAVRDKVLADWQANERRRAAETQAAAMMRDINAGRNILDVAGGAGLTVSRSAVTQRGHTAPDLPRGLADMLFSIKPGQATMVETPTAFVVAGIGNIVKADPAKAAADLQMTQRQLSNVMGNDIVSAYLNALSVTAKPQVNEALFSRLIDQVD